MKLEISTEWETLRNGDCRTLLKEVVKSQIFDAFWTFVILLNAVVMGINVQRTAYDPSRSELNTVAAEMLFTILFTIELLMRGLAVGFRRLFMFGRPGWVAFDVIVVAVSWFDLFVTYFL